MDESGSIKLQVSYTFDDIIQFKRVLKVFAINQGFKLKRAKNEKTKVTCTCTWTKYK